MHLHSINLLLTVIFFIINQKAQYYYIKELQTKAYHNHGLIKVAVARENARLADNVLRRIAARSA